MFFLQKAGFYQTVPQDVTYSGVMLFQRPFFFIGWLCIRYLCSMNKTLPF